MRSKSMPLRQTRIMAVVLPISPLWIASLWGNTLADEVMWMRLTMSWKERGESPHLSWNKSFGMLYLQPGSSPILVHILLGRLTYCISHLLTNASCLENTLTLTPLLR